MTWPVEMDPDFAVWLMGITQSERTEILGYVELLKKQGPNLRRPYVGKIDGSKHANMKELVIQIAGKPWRVLFAFDSKRSAFLLIGGNKGGDSRWYQTNIPIADARFDKHLADVQKQG
jgi:hypothetical protein